MTLLPVDGMTLRTIFLIVFVFGLAAFLYRDRNKMQRHAIIFFRRTKKGIKTIDWIANRFPRFWKFYANSGAFIAGFSILASLGTIVFVVYSMVTTQSASSGPSLILPGLVAENQFNPGVSFIPIEYWVVAIGVLMFVHELSHGIVARLEGFEINSVGWGVMAIIPFAFVEPKGEQMLPGADVQDSDEAHWNQGSWKSRVRVLCAGSFANYLTAGLFILFAITLSSAVTQPSGLIYNAQDEFPAKEAGMDNGTIKAVNGQEVRNMDSLMNITNSLEPGDKVSILSSEGNFTLTAVDREGHEGGYIGVELYGQQNIIKEEYSEYKGAFEWFASLIWTTAILNFFIGLFNMLPAKPLDGGWTVEALIERFAGERYTSYLDSFSILIWTVIAVTLALSLIGI